MTNRRTTWPRLTLALALGLIVALAAACGDDDSVVVPGEPPDDVVPEPPDEGVPDLPDDERPPSDPVRVEVVLDPDDAPEPDRVDERRDDVVDPRPIAIETVVAVAAGHLDVRFWGGVEPCFAMARVDVVETDETVTLTVFGGTPEGEEETVCIALAELISTEVELAEPLGDRVVFDGSGGGDRTGS